MKTTILTIRNMVKAALVACLWGLGTSVFAQSSQPADTLSPRHRVLKTERARRTPTGMIICGGGSQVRALEPFTGVAGGGLGYADAVNRYEEEFGPAVSVYCMIVPTAIAFYCPDMAREWTRDEQPVISAIYDQLNENVKPIDLFPTLGSHKEEPIYSRTDHHWAPLGAYYAAEVFAKAARVPFKPLSEYDRHVVHDYVGSMYRFSKDAAVKNAPEEFVYYTPRNVELNTVAVSYTLDKNRRKVVSQGHETAVNFFREYRDGSSSAYCTFMGGDTNNTEISTSVKNHRRLLILKDSYGNAVPSFLFHSFEKICVADCRYFTPNMRDYVEKNKITDILFVNNLGHAYKEQTAQSYHHYLEQ